VTTAVILGAGDLGGAVARQLAAADVVSAIVIIDEAESVATGKALDIRQSGAVDGFAAVVKGTASLDAVVGAGLVILADTAGSVEWQDDAGVQLVLRITALNQSAPIICAGAAQASVIERAVRDLGVARHRIFGTAPEALRSAIAALAALEAASASTDISVTIVGRPPQHIIVPWEDASIAGRRATSLLSPPAIRRLDARLARLWPPGPLALAAAACAAVGGTLGGASRTLPAFVAVTRDQAPLGRVGMLPVTLTAHGVGSVATPMLSTRDAVRLATALA
jgi:malate/lactate dehydrogenase